MASAPLNINDATRMIRHRVNVSDGQFRILEPQEGWHWIAAVSDKPTRPLSIDVRATDDWLWHFNDYSTSTRCWIFAAGTMPVYLHGLDTSAETECFTGPLPQTLAELVESEAEDSAMALAQLIGLMCRYSVLTGVPDEILRHDNAFDILRGCAAIARRLGLFETEVILLQSALGIRKSRNLMRLLSYAQANAQDYPRAIEAAQAAVAANPALTEGSFQQHLGELDAYGSLADELRHLATYRKRRSDWGGTIAYCLHSARPYGQGGYAMRSHGLAKAVQDLGHDLIAVARPGFPGDKHAPDLSASQTMVVEGVPYYFDNRFDRKGRAYGYLREAADYYEAMFRVHEIGIVQAATNFWTALPAAIAAFRLDLPFVYEVRSFWTVTREARIKNFAKSPQAMRDDALENITLAMADQIITLNPEMRDRLIAMGLDPLRTAIVPNSVDPDKFVPHEDAGALRAKYGIAPDDIVIGYMGAMLDYEGLDLLVDAVAPLSADDWRIKTLVVGANPDQFGNRAAVEHRLKQQIASHGLANRIELIEKVSPETAAQLYDVFDICVYPRRALEVCELVSPLKPLEAMAAGKTVIASNVGGHAAMLRHGQTGLMFQKEDVADLRSTLLLAIEDPDLRARLGQAAKEFVASERHWNLAAEQVVEVHRRAGQAFAFDPDQLLYHVATHFGGT